MMISCDKSLILVMQRSTKSTFKVWDSRMSEKYFRVVHNLLWVIVFCVWDLLPKWHILKLQYSWKVGEIIHIKEGIFITSDYARLWPVSASSVQGFIFACLAQVPVEALRIVVSNMNELQTLDQFFSQRWLPAKRQCLIWGQGRALHV